MLFFDLGKLPGQQSMLTTKWIPSLFMVEFCPVIIFPAAAVMTAGALLPEFILMNILMATGAALKSDDAEF